MYRSSSSSSSSSLSRRSAKKLKSRKKHFCAGLRIENLNCRHYIRKKGRFLLFLLRSVSEKILSGQIWLKSQSFWLSLRQHRLVVLCLYFYADNLKRFHGTNLLLFAFYFISKWVAEGEFHHKNTLLLLSFFLVFIVIGTWRSGWKYFLEKSSKPLLVLEHVTGVRFHRMFVGLLCFFL